MNKHLNAPKIKLFCLKADLPMPNRFLYCQPLNLCKRGIIAPALWTHSVTVCLTLRSQNEIYMLDVKSVGFRASEGVGGGKERKSFAIGSLGSVRPSPLFVRTNY